MPALLHVMTPTRAVVRADAPVNHGLALLDGGRPVAVVDHQGTLSGVLTPRARAAGAEAAPELSCGDLMESAGSTIAATTPLAQAIDQLLLTGQAAVMVTAKGRPVGVLSVDDVLTLAASVLPSDLRLDQLPGLPAAVTVNARRGAREARGLLAAHGAPALVVTRAGRIHGVLAPRQLSRKALRRVPGTTHAEDPPVGCLIDDGQAHAPAPGTDSVAETARRMVGDRLAHLPVVDRHGALLGLLDRPTLLRAVRAAIAKVPGASRHAAA